MQTVFISYQTIAHQQYIDEIKTALENYGLKVWTDTSEISHEPMRFSGLETSLFKGINESDCILSIMPNFKRKFTFEQKIKEFLDWSAIFLSYACWEEGSKALETENPYIWFILQKKFYKFFYDLDLDQKINESWQDYETRIGKQIGIKIIQIYLISDLTEENIICEKNIEIISPNNLLDGLSKNVIPTLLKPSNKKNLEMTKQGKALTKTLKIILSAISYVIYELATIFIYLIKSCLFLITLSIFFIAVSQIFYLSKEASFVFGISIIGIAVFFMIKNTIDFTKEMNDFSERKKNKNH